MTVLKRYLRETDESEIVVASRIGVNHHSLNRWLTDRQSPRICERCRLWQQNSPAALKILLLSNPQ